LPDTNFIAFTLDGSVGDQWSGRERRQVSRDFGQFTTGGKGSGLLSNVTLASVSSVTASALGSTRSTRPFKVWPPRERRTI
jgi:hypothetical protein